MKIRWILCAVILILGCSAEEPNISEDSFSIGISNVSEIVLGQWGPATECDKGYGVLQIQLQPELQKQLESTFEFVNASKITIYCGRIIGSDISEIK